jgi:hypothetical protein
MSRAAAAARSQAQRPADEQDSRDFLKGHDVLPHSKWNGAGVETGRLMCDEGLPRMF